MQVLPRQRFLKLRIQTRNWHLTREKPIRANRRSVSIQARSASECVRSVSVRQDYLRASFLRRARRALVFAARASDSALR